MYIGSDDICKLTIVQTLWTSSEAEPPTPHENPHATAHATEHSEEAPAVAKNEASEAPKAE